MLRKPVSGKMTSELYSRLPNYDDILTAGCYFPLCSPQNIFYTTMYFFKDLQKGT
jgi:hypothetical protein